MLSSQSIIEDYSNFVDIIIHKIRHKRDRFALMQWLDNFEQNDKLSALDILNRIVFIDDDELHIRAENLINELEEIAPKESKFIFFPIGKYAKSATLISYFFEHSASFSTLKKKGRAIFLSSEGDVKSAIFDSTSVLVFFDDFLGTGKSFLKSYEQIDKISGQGIKHIPLQFSVSICRMRLAEETIKNALPKMVFLGELHHKIFGENPPMFNPTSEIERQKLLAIKYAARHSLFVDYQGNHHLGYLNSEALISFSYRPPNNTLPIIWSNKNKWKPLLPRFQNEIYSSVNEYKDRLMEAAAKLEFKIANSSVYPEKLNRMDLPLMLILAMLKRKTSEPLIAVLIGISGSELTRLLQKGIGLGYLDPFHKITDKGNLILIELDKIVTQISTNDNLKKTVINYNIEYLSKTVSGK